MSLKHAMLGFLSFKPFSGYGLKKAFDRSVQHFWPANQSQIYRTLSDMEEEGLVEVEVIERENRLDKKLYHPTPAGEQELHDWLSTPREPAEFREPFLIQLYFGGKLSDEELIHVLDHEIQSLEEQINDYTKAYREYQAMLESYEHPRAFFFSVATMEYGLNSGLAGLEWLNSVKKRVESGDYQLIDFKSLEKDN